MTDNGDGTFTAVYGRVGSKQAAVNYPITEWQTKYNEKIRKGYVDNTHLFSINTPNTDASSIKDLPLRKLMENFLKYAQKSIANNYVVSASEVTQKQVDEAQSLVNELIKMVGKKVNVEDFNTKLLELFKIIPRRMAHVKDHLLQEIPKTKKEINQLREKIVEEQSTLDVMRSQVEINEKQVKQTTQDADLLTLMGLKVEKVEDLRINKLIKLMMGEHSEKFIEAFSVINIRTQQQFDKHLTQTQSPKTQLLWHGSRNENWLSILKTGLVLRPINAIITGKMFGYGLYFANEFSKSLNYSSVQGAYWTSGRSQEGYLAIFEVHTGTQFEISEHEDWHTKLDDNKLKAMNQSYDSVFAKRGVSLRNNEFIIYNENQCTIKYVVKVK
jgi:poly [ADP-ribose] polymerase